MEDKLIITDVPGLAGEYECDLVEMLSEGQAGSLTGREGHRIKLMSGIRVGELGEAFESGDSDVLVAMAAVILARHGKRFEEDVLWDAPLGRISFDIAKRTEEGDAVPPAESPQSGEPDESGSDSLSRASAIRPVSDRSSTGSPESERSAISDQTISAL